MSRSEVTSTSILLYGCETWTLLADSEKKDPGFWIKCLGKLLRNSYLEHKTNDWVRSKINFFVVSEEPLLATVKRRKPAWFGYLTHHDSLSTTIVQGTLLDWRCRGRQRKCWMDNIEEWTSLPMPELLKRGPCRKRLEGDLCWVVLHVSSMTQSVKELK